MRTSTIQKSLVLAGFVALALAPLVLDVYRTQLLITFFGYGVALLGYNLIFAYTGLLSFGHALFVAVGSYTVAFMTSRFGLYSMELALVMAIATGAAVAVVVGAMCARYVEVYFAMLTFAFGMLFYTAILKSYNLTGGDEGMPVDRPNVLGLDMAALGHLDFLTGPYYYYALGVFAIATLVMWRIVRSPFGLALKTIRDNPEKAEFLGIPIRIYRWYAFVIAGIFGAVGGALMAPVDGQVDPSLAYWTESGTVVFMVLLGGFANFIGPLVGALVYINLLDWVQSLTEYWRIAFGGILAVIVIVAPGGLMGLFGTVARRVLPGLAAGEAAVEVEKPRGAA